MTLTVSELPNRHAARFENVVNIVVSIFACLAPRLRIRRFKKPRRIRFRAGRLSGHHVYIQIRVGARNKETDAKKIVVPTAAPHDSRPFFPILHIRISIPTRKKQEVTKTLALARKPSHVGLIVQFRDSHPKINTLLRTVISKQ